ncbi:MAG: tail protein X [Faecousia sp.]
MSKTYTTVQGDMWDSIAYKTLGSVEHTNRIMSANPSLYKYFVFPAGVVVNIPDSNTGRNYDNLPPWKKVSG